MIKKFPLLSITSTSIEPSGLPKTVAMVRNKWVSHIYQDIKGFQGKLGCHWDNMHGARVCAELGGEVFESYTKTHPLICPFKNCGWEYYTLLLDIIPNSVAQGANAFVPHIPQTATTSVAEDAEWNETVLGNSSAIPLDVRSSNAQSGQATTPTPPSAPLSSTSALDSSGNIPPSSTPPASLGK
ncbi:hypothetical protein F5141DRAFT_1254803 [Pisolithus sp. B1]|nr:hypothetical protein F5141DRAFT_1254803 [Pisolithus sp. B1]